MVLVMSERSIGGILTTSPLPILNAAAPRPRESAVLCNARLHTCSHCKILAGEILGQGYYGYVQFSFKEVKAAVSGRQVDPQALGLDYV